MNTAYDDAFDVGMRTRDGSSSSREDESASERYDSLGEDDINVHQADRVIHEEEEHAEGAFPNVQPEFDVDPWGRMRSTMWGADMPPPPSIVQARRQALYLRAVPEGGWPGGPQICDVLTSYHIHRARGVWDGVPELVINFN